MDGIIDNMVCGKSQQNTRRDVEVREELKQG